MMTVGRGFLFLLTLRIGRVILLWQGLGPSYNYFSKELIMVFLESEANN